ncbi:MAG: DUF3995 domain-containing protein [Polyangiaceae bacterium]
MMNASFSLAVLSGNGSGAAIAATCLVLLAALHSALGERLILRPLFADGRWSSDLPRGATQSILRGAWHLTSLFWLGLAATFSGLSLTVATAIACLAAGAMILVGLRSHLAWPLFLLAGLASLDAGRQLPSVVVYGLVGTAALIAVFVAGAHLYWAAGGRRGASRAVPTRDDGAPLFAPGPLACAAVALALTTFAGLLLWVALGAPPWWPRVGLGLGLLVLILRAVGDGRYLGFSKADHRSAFARADDALFTPLVVTLAFGALAAFRLAAS